MKKFILCAIIVMAMVGTSFGKTGEVEVKKVVAKEVVLSKACDAAGSAAVRWYYNNVPGATLEGARSLRASTVKGCEAGEKKI